MRSPLDVSLKNLKWIRVRKKWMSVSLMVLSLMVSLHVFWSLRQPALTLAGDASCGIQEHTHSDACGTERQVCTLSEEPHLHGETCFEKVTLQNVEAELICGIPEDPAGEEDGQPSDPAAEPHRHTESCFAPIPETEILVCPLSEEAHTHGDGCREWDVSCGLEAHVHSISCYSDSTADVETLLDWQKMFEDYPFTGKLKEDLVGIAKTQVGYTESKRNFEVGSDGIRRGYTRYGAWYGTPYRDWSAMFVSYCLHYAGADPEEMPGNTGAASMAELWKELEIYAPAEEHTPVSGDLVFFDDNTVGIVAEINKATFYVIRGDVSDAVTCDLLSLDDETIVGWGLTKETEPAAEDPGQTEEKTEATDICDGITETGATRKTQQMQQPILQTTETPTDLKDYLVQNGGSYFFTLQELDGRLPTEVGENQFVVQVNTVYELTITFSSPNGFHMGTYEYQLPEGVVLIGNTGDFIVRTSEADPGVHVGTWLVSEDNLITMTFNENINDMSEVTLSAVMRVHFPERENPLTFDGDITVTVEKPSTPTEVIKIGQQGGTPGAKGDDPTKIYWTIHIIGHEGSQIPGSILTDQLLDREWSKAQTFTESDIAGGLTFGVSDPNGEWHQCTIAADDENLIWNETGWTLKMPETIRCWCGDVVLGNDNWQYFIQFSSTPTPTGVAGTAGYENGAWIDGQSAIYWADFKHAEIPAEVTKTGTFRSDAEGGAFGWELQVAIPGWTEGTQAQYHWYLVDEMYLQDDAGVRKEKLENNGNNAIVTVHHNGTDTSVPEIHEATENDLFAWENAWSAVENGITYGREFNLLCRCQCNAENCKLWSGTSCNSIQGWYVGNQWYATDFCQCWTVTGDALFTLAYETDALPLMEEYGGIGYGAQNYVELLYKPGADVPGERVNAARAVEPIPGIFSKTLGHGFNGYTANYIITFNEAKLPLTDGSPLTIHDVMTETLAFINGSLVITTEDANGNTTKLTQDRDYTVTYDGTGQQKDQDGNAVHVLDVVILHPQPVMYTLDYDTTLIVPKVVTESIRYSNSASVTLWGKNFSAGSEEMGYSNINIAARSYKVQVEKTCAVTGDPLQDAVFGLFNANDGLIAKGKTDADGKILFETDVVEGIILREKTLYYVQELEAPIGYMLDHTRHWFCFCANATETCETCDALVAATDAFRIPNGQTGKIYVTNELTNYDLPATGGPGIYPLMLVSTLFVMIPVTYGLILWRKRERRDTV